MGFQDFHHCPMGKSPNKQSGLVQEGRQGCTCLPRAVSVGLMWRGTGLPRSSSLSLYLLIATVPHLVSIDGAIAGVLSVSALLQRGGRTDGDLLCSKHSPGTGESRGDSGCLPDRQEPAAAEATHGPDTGMQPTYLSMPPHLLQPFSVRASSGEALPRDPWLSEACVTMDPSLPSAPQTEEALRVSESSPITSKRCK